MILLMILFTTPEAARLYRIPERTIRQWWADGRLTRYGTPGRAKWDASELSQLVDLRAGVSNLPRSDVRRIM